MTSESTQPHRYQAYGLRLGSKVPFPEMNSSRLPLDTGALDMEFAMVDEIAWSNSGTIVLETSQSDDSNWLTCRRTGDGYTFHFPELADYFSDSNGQRILGVARSGIPPESTRHLFLDQVVPLLLNLRGMECLHASAIQTARGVCAFLGRSGQGKSTLAAAFHAAGFPVICDDCLLIKEHSDCIAVEPTYPGLRLWDDSREVIFGSALSTSRVCHYTSKQRISTPDVTMENASPRRLLRIYSLQLQGDSGPGELPIIESFSARDAFMELFAYAFRLDLTDKAMILRQMHVLERVVTEIPVKRLLVPENFEHLPVIRNLILNDLAQG